MRCNLIYLYWTLLLVTTVSSCLLFYLVAADATITIRPSMPMDDIATVTEEPQFDQVDPNEMERPITDTEHWPTKEVVAKRRQKPKPVDINQFVFLEAVSKNSGITTNGLPEMPATPSVIALGNGAKTTMQLEKALDNSLDAAAAQEQNKTENVTQQLSGAAAAVTAAAASAASAAATSAAAAAAQFTIVEQPPVPPPIDETDPAPVDDVELPTKDDSVAQEVAPLTADVNLTLEENPIPVFSEWAQQQMEEAEKKLEQAVVNSSTAKKNSTTGGSKPALLKIRAKNYASPDCGAKIIASNPESDSTAAVLSSSKDEYLLSPCTSRIWFVVELCEPIQAEKIDFANFELFSSSPKDFTVSISSRFPTRDWTTVGQFTARDERDIQRFDLSPHVFGKFVRVEIHSHYNSEHFCPVSLFRVFGTSELEAFETANRPITAGDQEYDQDDDDDDDEEATVPLSGQRTKGSENNLLQSAGYAVISIVKKAAEALVKTNKGTCMNTTHPRTDVQTGCITLSHIVLCENCPDDLGASVTELLACHSAYLTTLLSSSYIRQAVYRSQICYSTVGIDLRNEIVGKWPAVLVTATSSLHSDSTSIEILKNHKRDYISHVFPIRYMAAMCNVVAVWTHKVGLNVTATSAMEGENAVGGGDHQSNLTIDRKRASIVDPDVGVGVGSVPKNLAPVEKVGPVSSGETVRDSSEEMLTKEPMVVDEPQQGLIDDGERSQIPSPLIADDQEAGGTLQVGSGNGDEASSHENVNIFNIAAEEQPPAEQKLEADIPASVSDPAPPGELISDNDPALSNGGTASAAGAAAATQPANQKVFTESVFLRLSNRIKALERNMSLSGQYLEELSRRYKKQVEELQHSFAKTLVSIEEHNRRSGEREQQLSAENQALRRDLDNVTANLYTWHTFVVYGATFACVQVLVLCVLLRACGRGGDNGNRLGRDNDVVAIKVASPSLPQRRNSIDCTMPKEALIVNRRRRPSEEALNIGGTYENLLIEVPKQKMRAPKAKHRKTSTGSAPVRARARINLERHESTPANFASSLIEKVAPPHDVSPSQFIGSRIQELTPLEDNDEIYLPGTGLVFNEFTNGSATVNATTPQPIVSSVHKLNKEAKTRRLSSPAFLKSALSRTSQNGNKKKGGSVSSGGTTPPTEQPNKTPTTATGWEWYRLRKGGDKQRTPPIMTINGGGGVGGDSGDGDRGDIDGYPLFNNYVANSSINATTVSTTITTASSNSDYSFILGNSSSDCSRRNSATVSSSVGATPTPAIAANTIHNYINNNNTDAAVIMPSHVTTTTVSPLVREKKTGTSFRRMLKKMF